MVGASWTGSGVLKQRTSPPGSAVALGSAITYYLVNDGSSATAAISAAANVIVQDVGSDLYFDYTHTSGTVTVTVMAAGELIGSEEGLLPVLNPAFTGTMTGPAITLTGALTAGTKLVSTTALATPSALAATAFNAFASTVSGATLMGYGTTADVTLKSRAGNDAFLVLANSINCSALGTLKSTGDFTVGASTFVVTAATGAVAASGNVTQTHGTEAAFIVVKSGASANSTKFYNAGTAIGLWDTTNTRSIFQYDPAANDFYIAGARTLLSGALAITGALTGVMEATISTSSYFIGANGLEQRAANALAAFNINYAGYAGGTTQFRNFAVYDGKNAVVAEFAGTTKALTLYGTLTTDGGLQTFGANDSGGAGKRLVLVPNV